MSYLKDVAGVIYKYIGNVHMPLVEFVPLRLTSVSSHVSDLDGKDCIRLVQLESRDYRAIENDKLPDSKVCCLVLHTSTLSEKDQRDRMWQTAARWSLKHTVFVLCDSKPPHQTKLGQSYSTEFEEIFPGLWLHTRWVQFSVRNSFGPVVKKDE